MAIASVVQGMVETEDGKIFELDSRKGARWLESITSFRYEPTGVNKPYTVRKETKKGGDYWYGYRKVAGNLHKRYMGKTADISVAKLEEFAEALNTLQQPRVTQAVTEKVIYISDHDRLKALELEVIALQESLEALLTKWYGKGKTSVFYISPKPSAEVTEGELHLELSNLKAESEALRQELAKQKEDYAAQLAISKEFKQEVQELRSQLEAVQAELFDAKAIITSLDPSPVVSALRLEIGRLQTELEICRQKSASTSALSDKAAKVVSFFRPLLNKKAPANLLSKIEEILEE